MSDILAAQNALEAVLGKKWDDYQTLLRRWFKRQISKPQLDNSVRSLLKSNVGLHTAFILSILHECQDGSGQSMVSTGTAPLATPHRPGTQPVAKGANTSRGSSTSSSSVATSDVKRNGIHQAASPSAYKLAVPTTSRKSGRPLNQNGKHRFTRIAPYPVRTFNQNVGGGPQRAIDADAVSWRPDIQPVLPDMQGLQARLEAHALRANLDGVSEDVPKLLLCAVETYVKNILMESSQHAASTVVRELRDHDYARKPLLAPPLRLSNGRARPPTHRLTNGTNSMLEQRVPSQNCVLDAASCHSEHRGPARSSSLGPSRISTIDVYNAAQVNRSLLGSRSVSLPMMQQLRAIL